MTEMPAPAIGRRVPGLPDLPSTLQSLIARFDGRFAVALTVGALLMITLVLAALIVVPAPTLGGGDYGQWLMVARPFRGLDVPAYRNIAALPGMVPAVIASLWTVLGNPIAALDILNAVLLAGMVAGLAAGGWALFRHPVAAIAGPVLGLLVFDRFVELFAFGGILQLAADAASLGALAALIAAESQPRGWGLRVVAALLLVVVGLSHVGTTEATLPVFLALTALFGLRHARRSGVLIAIREHLVPLLVLAPVAIYWLIELLPANRSYFTNPATAAYRDPGSFVASLFAYVPNAIVLSVGALALVSGLIVELRARRLGPWCLIGIWSAVVWGELGGLVLLGTSTDYPRFATVLAPPLLLGAAGATAAIVRRVVMWRGSAAWPPMIAAAAIAVVLITPIAAQRDGAFNRYYAAPSAASLDAATRALDAALGPRSGAVLTTVRAGKWLEGTTGRESLFAQPTRFAVRPAEWQRSLDAEVLANSAAAIASPSFLIEYQRIVTGGGHASLGDLVIAANHDGEWVDLFASIVRDTFVVDSAGAKHPGAAFVPIADANQGVADGTASIATSWMDPSGFHMDRTVSASGTGHTARLVETAAGAVTTRLYPADGVRFTSISGQANTAIVCFTLQGQRQPCVGLSLADPTGSIAAIGDGGLWVRGGSAGGLDLTLTNLTAGTPIVGLESLRPADILDSRHVVGAILETTAHGYADAVARLESIGLARTGTDEGYAVFVRR
jgi:hypothetical protein